MRLLTGRALLFVLGLALFEPGAGAQLFTNLASLVYQIRDPFLSGDTAGPKAVATADFDADGKTDLAVANTDGSVSVFFGQGGGRFSLAKHLVTGASSLRGILCADLNGDGKADIAVAAPYNCEIIFFFNGGVGEFSPPIALPAWHGVRNLAAGDFDGDGILDLMVAGTTNGLRHYRGLGGGVFTEITNLTALASSVSIQDSTKFPKPVYCLRTFRPAGAGKDLLAVTHAETNRVWMIGMDANGATTVLSSLTNHAKSHSLEVGRVFNPVNMEGTPFDLITAQRDAGTIEVHRGLGPGLFDQNVSKRITVVGGPRAVQLVDVDADGWNDLAVVLEDADTVLTFANHAGDLSPGPDKERPVGSSPREMASAFFDSDGFPDLAVINRNSKDASILLAFEHQVGYRGVDHLYLVDGEVAGLAVMDFNGDGRADVIQLHRASGDFSVRLAGTNGLLGPPTFYTIGSLPAAQVVAFVNNDSIPDHVSVNLGQLGVERASVSVRLGLGDGTFGLEKRYELPPDVEGRLFALVPADFDGDGNIDLAVGFLDSRIAFFKGSPDGSFSPTRIHPFAYSARGLVAADFDHDGKIDLAAASANGDLWIVLNTNNLLNAVSLSAKVYPAPTNGFAVRTLISSTNRDGGLDLIAGSAVGAYVYHGRPDGSFLAPTPLGGGTFAISSAVLADFDGDTNKEMVLAGRFLDAISVFTLADGQYVPALTLDVPASQFIATGDLDGDGHPDLVGSGRILWTALSGSKPQSTAPLVLAGQRSTTPAILINEMLAMNTSLPIADTPSGDEHTVGWVELYNGSGTPVSLNGWKLRCSGADQGGQIQANDFVFPSIVFQVGQHLLVYFSENKRTVYHTGFRLPSDGGTLLLLNPAGTNIDRVDYPPQREDISYARFKDALPTFVSNPFPSPGRANLLVGRAAPLIKFDGVDAAALRSNGTVRIYVQVQDDAGLADLSMYFQRLDIPISPVQQIQLYDDGQHGDGGISDGRFAGEIAGGLPDGAEIQFYFRGIDLSDNEYTLPDEPDFGEPGLPGNVYAMGIGFPSPPIELSEVVSRNANSLHDETGGTPDWVEVRNPSTVPLPLDGIILTQQLGDNSRYVFPSGKTLAPGEHFVIYCDNNSEQGPLHAPFSLSSSGDEIMLTGLTSNGARTLIDWTSFGSLSIDQAWARLGAGGNWRTTTATPAACNVATWLGFVETNGIGPVFTFAFPTTTNALYTVEQSPTLTASNWIPIMTIPGDGIEKVIRRPLTESGFFRVRRVP